MNATEHSFVHAVRGYAASLVSYNTRLFLYEQAPGYRDPPEFPSYSGPTPAAVLGSLLDERVPPEATYAEVREAIIEIGRQYPRLRALDDFWRSDWRRVTDALAAMGVSDWEKVRTPEETAAAILDKIADLQARKEEADLWAYRERGLL